MCIFENCKNYSTYNYIDETIALYCRKHKLKNMINIKDKKCIYNNCNIQPTYNYENKKSPKYCNIHKSENMIDIQHKKCIYENCKTQPNFNYEGEKTAFYCRKHKLHNMIDVKNKNKNCKNYLCYTRSTEKYDGYCTYCFINLFPDKKVSRNYKTKERTITDYIISQYPNINWVCDKRVQDGCSKRRPDLFLDLGYQILIIEVDENQHIDYDCSCENKRLMELFKDVGHRPIVFIRFNPDEYNNITSCWGINKSGVYIIKKSKINEWNERLLALKRQIDYWLESATDKTIEVIQLFYDTTI